ncbi:hypothetical protein M918_19380 [Clostridium sp. BL8]|nr:hypothetical protein M918_19380 [Clostridium sp. BL8]
MERVFHYNIIGTVCISYVKPNAILAREDFSLG